jgi:hypothetical protein
MITTEEVRVLLQGSGKVLAADGSRIGTIEQVYLDDRTSEPEWIRTRTGLIRGKDRFVPLVEAGISGEDVVVPVDRASVKRCPDVGGLDGHLTGEQKAELYRYYGHGYDHSTQADVGD